MDVRARKNDTVMDLGVIDLYSNGKELAEGFIMPFRMRTPSANTPQAWIDHSYNVAMSMKHYMPNARIHILPPPTDSVNKYIADNNIKIVNISLSAYGGRFYQDLAKIAFVFVSAANDGANGESHLARLEDVCAVGAVDSNLRPMGYSSWGHGAVKTCAVSGLRWDFADRPLHGTSFASPVVAVLVADWANWVERMTGYFPSIQAINDFVIKNSHDIWEEGRDLRTGYGLFRLPHRYECTALEIKPNSRIGVQYKYIEGEEPKVKEVDLITTPFIQNDRMFIGLRGAFEGMNSTVEWNDSERKAIFIK